jgi:hypothetical protein
VVSQKVPRDRTATDALEARPAAPIDGDADADALSPVATAPVEVPELTDGQSGAELSDLLDEPERKEGPAIPVPPPRVDVGGVGTGRGEPGAAGTVH